ncbi:TonB family protein [Novosphingobium sp. RD2P27]|uniref:TonB family protein n=1 Tax=Novosphingobium kalidii TaxID=3230299 RepID=A0ABV2D4H3_9SPHN
MDPQLARAVPHIVRERRLLLLKKHGGGPIPRGNSAYWVTNDDYPTQALRECVEGLVRIQASVGDSGKAASCRVTESTGKALLDKTTCGVFLRRARFRPPVAPQERTATYEHSWVFPPPEQDGS